MVVYHSNGVREHSFAYFGQKFRVESEFVEEVFHSRADGAPRSEPEADNAPFKVPAVRILLLQVLEAVLVLAIFLLLYLGVQVTVGFVSHCRVNDECLLLCSVKRQYVDATVGPGAVAVDCHTLDLVVAFQSFLMKQSIDAELNSIMPLVASG